MDNSPRNCGQCGSKGKVLDSRQSNGLIVRRLVCGHGHRFTTIETRPRVSYSGRALTANYRVVN